MRYRQQEGQIILLDFIRSTEEDPASSVHDVPLEGGLYRHLNGLLDFVDVSGCMFVDDEQFGFNAPQTPKGMGFD